MKPLHTEQAGPYSTDEDQMNVLSDRLAALPASSPILRMTASSKAWNVYPQIRGFARGVLITNQEKKRCDKAIVIPPLSMSGRRSQLGA